MKIWKNEPGKQEVEALIAEYFQLLQKPSRAVLRNFAGYGKNSCNYHIYSGIAAGHRIACLT